MGKRLLSYMEYHALERRLTPCAEFPNDNQDLHHGAIWIGREPGREPVCELPRARVLATAFEEEPMEPDFGLAPSASLPEDSSEPIVGLLTIDEHPGDSGEPVIGLPTIDERGGHFPAEAEEFPESLLAEDADPIEIVDELSFDDSLDDLPAVLRATEPEPVSDGAAEPASEPAAPADAFAQLVASLEDVARALGAGDEAVACLDALFGHSRMEGVAAGNHVAEALIAGGVVARGTRGLVRSGPFTAKVLAWQGILRGESEDFSLADGGALEPLDEWAADLVARVVGPPARAEGIRRDLRRRGIAAFGLVAKAA
jgi:hypothetical protein